MSNRSIFYSSTPLSPCCTPTHHIPHTIHNHKHIHIHTLTHSPTSHSLSHTQKCALMSSRTIIHSSTPLPPRCTRICLAYAQSPPPSFTHSLAHSPTLTLTLTHSHICTGVEQGKFLQQHTSSAAPHTPAATPAPPSQQTPAAQGAHEDGE